ncbi:hypothetical protein [Streptomyces sp. AK04-3B]|uniref:hypothetical protein n=1 Tax=Streptomyces sp. AK04-3B TaxID=3028650 RepID=UPI0029B87919|nr:hypothetical protein [Streptomyces sp. AK04-3B]MDX3803049.1 hypothetical protein [Streptomyces sp. AK04-3B]
MRGRSDVQDVLVVPDVPDVLVVIDVRAGPSSGRPLVPEAGPRRTAGPPLDRVGPG